MAKLIDITGKAISGEWGNDDNNGTGIPVLRTTNFTNEGVINYNNVVTRDIKKKDLSQKYLQPGDIIIEKSGGSDKQPVGRVVYFDGEPNRYLFNNFTGGLRVRNKDKWEPRYVFYALFGNYINGGTRRYENKTTGLHNLKTDQYVQDFDIKEQPIEYQKMVVTKLDDVTGLIALRKEQLTKLDELVKARFVELFGSVDCRISTFGNEFNFISRGKSPSYVECSDLAVINQACIYWDTINYGKVKFNDNAYCGDRVLQYGDVLINSTGTGTLGRANIFNSTGRSQRYMADSHVTIVRGSATCNPVYIKCFLEQAKTQKDIYRLCVSGSTNQIELSKEKFRLLKLPVPPLELQNQFAAFVEQTDKSKLEIQQSLDKLETLKKALMQEYFG